MPPVLKAGNVDQEIIDKVKEALSEEPEDKGVPKRDGSGRGIRTNFNRGGCYDILRDKYEYQIPKKKHRRVYRNDIPFNASFKFLDPY